MARSLLSAVPRGETAPSGPDRMQGAVERTQVGCVWSRDRIEVAEVERDEPAAPAAVVAPEEPPRGEVAADALRQVPHTRPMDAATMPHSGQGWARRSTAGRRRFRCRFRRTRRGNLRLDLAPGAGCSSAAASPARFAQRRPGRCRAGPRAASPSRRVTTSSKSARGGIRLVTRRIFSIDDGADLFVDADQLLVELLARPQAHELDCDVRRPARSPTTGSDPAPCRAASPARPSPARRSRRSRPAPPRAARAAPPPESA